MAKRFTVSICLVTVLCTVAFAASRPELRAYPFKTSVTAGGTYANGSTVGTDFVVSGTITSELTFSSDVPYRVTLNGATVSKTITLSGDATLWLVGDNAVETTAATAISSTGTLTIGGPGSVTLASVPTKKQTGPVIAEDLVVAGGNVSIVLNADVKNVAGITLTGDYVQMAGSVAIDCASYGAVNKVNGILVNKKSKSVTVEGGRLSVAVCGEKSVGVSLDKSGTTMLLSGGTVELAVAGDGAKGIKGDETFTMTGGLLNASVTGNVLYENYEDGDGSNYVVKVSSTSLLSSTGSYVVQDTSPAYAVKCGNISISGGTVRVSATGIASRGLCADANGGTFDISGGFFDVTCAGGASNTILEMLDETALTTDIDKATACGLRTSETNSVFRITGGTLNLVANGTGGKCIVAKGELVVGTSGQTTTPSDSAFLPDIQAATYGTQIYVAAQKQKNYLSVGTATVADLASTTYYFASNKVVTASGENVDHSNPKCIKAEGNLTMHGGRIRGFSQAEGGEGFESKKVMTINGGVFEATTYDDLRRDEQRLHRLERIGFRLHRHQRRNRPLLHGGNARNRHRHGQLQRFEDQRRDGRFVWKRCGQHGHRLNRDARDVQGHFRIRLDIRGKVLEDDRRQQDGLCEGAVHEQQFGIGLDRLHHGRLLVRAVNLRSHQSVRHVAELPRRVLPIVFEKKGFQI